MSIIHEAYARGQQAAFDKFAGLSAAGIRGAVPNVPMAQTAASAAAPSLRSVQVQGKPAAPAAPQPAAGAQGLMQRAWGGLNKVVSHPLGSLGLSIAAPLAIGSMMSSNQQQ